MKEITAVLNKVALVLNVNRNYTNQLNVFLYSLDKFGNVGDIEFDILIYTRDLLFSDIKYEVENKKITIIKVDVDDFSIPVDCSGLVDELNYENYIASASLRVYAMNTLHEKYEQMVYMDTDLIVCDDVCYLFSSMDCNVDIEASLDSPLYYRLFGRTDKIESQESLNNNKKYFNSGVMKINLRTITRYGDLVKKFNNHAVGKFYDQCFLNDVFEFQRIKLLSRRYNSSYLPYLDLLPFSEIQKFKKNHENSMVKHYASAIKPWSEIENILNSGDLYSKDVLCLMLYVLDIGAYYEVAKEISSIISSDFMENLEKNVLFKSKIIRGLDES